MAREARKAVGGVTVMVGGPHLSAVPVETMQFCPDFDIGFIGESEGSFEDVLKSGISPEALSGIRGIVYREGGKPRVNGRREFIPDIDSLPFPAWDLIEDMSLYRPAVTNYRKEPVFSLMTSRGCFGRCIFCDRGVFGNRVRLHSVDYVMRMIRTLRHRFGINEITFYDDNMVVDRRRMEGICRRIVEEEKGLSWACSARADLVTADMLRAMRRAGCWQISYGIESGSDSILKKIQKGVTVEKIRKAVTLARRVGISVRGYFIVGSPGETRETLEETLRLILELGMDDILVEYMTPYPGTELYGKAADYGILKGDWSTLNSYDMNFIPHGMDEATLRDYFMRYYKSFYLRPRIIANYVMRLKSPAKMLDLARKYFKFSRTNESR